MREGSPSRQATLAAAWDSLENAPSESCRAAERLLKTDPADPDATLLLAILERREGRLAAARKRLEPLMGAESVSPAAWLEWGQIHAASGADTEALEALHRAVTISPAFAAAWRALGDLLLALGRADHAVQAYAGAARAANKDPSLAAAAAALGEGRAPHAAQRLAAHLAHAPNDIRAVRLLAEALMRTGQPAEAQSLLESCLQAAPAFADARHSLATLLYRRQHFAGAAAHMRTLLDLQPHQPALRILLAVCLCKTGGHQAALPLFEQMLAAAPANHAMLLVYGHSLKALGRERDAARAYRACLAAAPGWAPGLYLSLADLKTVKLTDPDLAAIRRATAATSGFEKAQLCYAAGHALDQRGDYPAAFAAFAEGAAIRRQATAYDPAETTEFVAAAKRIFTRDFFAARAGSGCPTPGPIFIAGLPRSGSTLVEQILASHSQVEGTAELHDIGRMATGLLEGRPTPELPNIIATLNARSLSALGELYLAETAQHRRLGRPFFIDKMPANILHTGLIHLILPNARIIDVRRHPMAAAFAAFRQFFQPDQKGADFTYDLHDIARYQRDYAALTALFDEILPARVLRVEYEDLVTGTEPQIRTLLAHCGLEFEPACLRFWETPRAVQTPSAQQVRRPITRSGLEHWRNYERWLGDLRKEGLLF